MEVHITLCEMGIRNTSLPVQALDIQFFFPHERLHDKRMH